MKLRQRAAVAIGISVALVGTVLVAPAEATISFCQTGRNKPCLGPINGCAMILGGGRYAFAEDGDTVIAANGAVKKCVKGKWVTQKRALSINTANVLGRGSVVSSFA